MTLTLILIAIVCSTVTALALLNLPYQYENILTGLAGIFLLLASGVAAICYAFMAWSWIAADTKAAIINREYGTSYTREEIFFASDVIETIRQIDRKRIEVNGDLMREKKAK
jgi:hypothetical protein